MDVRRLHFFDKDGYDMNFTFNEIRGCWEGNVYLPKTSIGLYANTTIYLLEEYDIPVEFLDYKKHRYEDKFSNNFIYPRKSGENDEPIICQWDLLNNYVDEFFMFTFDDTYIEGKHSSLDFINNNGPDLVTLLINKFDKYEIPLDDTFLGDRKCHRAVPIHVAFSANIKQYDNTFKRTLVLRHKKNEIARITFFCECVGEDERLRIWNYNLGYHLTPEDTIIFRDKDIKEPMSEYILLNEKRKEFMIEGHNIYPYIGSYKAIISMIKFFGYDNINLIEFWRNVNRNDVEFGKMIMNPRYILSDKDCTFVKTSIPIPNTSWRKANKLALTYTIHTPSKEVDLFEIPYITEDFKYTMEEILIKLVALKNKLNKEFMPSNSRIIDIIGEAFYFGIQLHKNAFTKSLINFPKDPHVNVTISAYPNNTVHISDDKYFNDFVFEMQKDSRNIPLDNITILNNIRDMSIEELENECWEAGADNVRGSVTMETHGYDYNSDEHNPNYPVGNGKEVPELTEERKADLYKRYYNSLTHTFIRNEDAIDTDLYHKKDVSDVYFSSLDNEYVTKLGKDISAKVVLSNTTFRAKKFKEMPMPFKYVGAAFNKTYEINSFQNLVATNTKFKDYFDPNSEVYHREYGDPGLNTVTSEIEPVYVEWTVKYSDNQTIEEGHDTERQEYYDRMRELRDAHNNKALDYLLDWKPRIESDYKQLVENPDENRKHFKAVKYGKIDEMKDVLFELPYVGYYDVTLSILKPGMDRENIPFRTFKKYIKVEPYEIDIRGFYYDAREILKNIHYDYEYWNENDLLDIGKEDQENMEDFILKTLGFMTYIAKLDESKRDKKYRGKRPGGYNFDMVWNKYLNRKKNGLWILDGGPYQRRNFNIGDYFIQDGIIMIDNVNEDIVNLLPNLKTARYIHNGVDVKPFTWIYLTFDYSKIARRSEPKWILTNTSTGKKIEYDGKYFTCLLVDEGYYTLELTLSDIYDNKYSVKRNLIVVDEFANHKLYTPFKQDYDAMKELNEFKERVALDEFINLGKFIEDNTGDYFFDLKNLILWDCSDPVEGPVVKPTGTVDGRLTIRPQHGLGWRYDIPISIGHFDELVIDFDDKSIFDDDIVIYFFDGVNNQEFRLDDQHIRIKMTDLTNVDKSNIVYIIMFNKNNVSSNNKAEIKIENMYLNYEFDVENIQ